MSTNDEMRSYLGYLVRHQKECTVDNCADCLTAQSIYAFTRNMIFSAVAYPNVAIPSGRRAASVAGTPSSGRRASRRAA